MKKRVLILVAGILSIHLISFMYYAWLYYPVRLFPFADYIAIRWGYYLLRYALCVVFGWWLASYEYKPYGINKQKVFSRFFKRTWVVFALTFVVFILLNTDSLLQKIDIGVFFFVWDFFNNQGVAPEAYSMPYEIWSPTSIFILESFGDWFTHLSMVLLYLSYQFRAALSSVVLNEGANLSASTEWRT